ncbi:hypothetical protein [Vreelandella titanicae]|uniref:hypothetical protein n=1 Tax=Vreelandella titanicae TaxID=664683 RepID=UPI00382A6689
MERNIENLEAIIEQLSVRNEELEKEKLERLNEYDALAERVDALVKDNVELRRQLVSMRAA